MAHLFKTPAYNFIGTHALEEAMAVMERLGKKALIVTGQSMIKQGHVAFLEALLEENGIQHTRFGGITGEPTDTMILEGADVYKKEKCDFVIGFGGGSALDSAKAIAVVAYTGKNIVQFKGKTIDAAMPPVVAIPSTAGTGSEATPFTIITDTASDEKLLLKGDGLLPTVAVVDSKYSLQSPASVTMATGMDALTHAIEAYASRKAFPESDLFCLSAVKRIFNYLPQVVTDGTDELARQEMAIAAFEAGIGIANSSVTVVHGMSRPIGALFHVAHGISNAMLLSKCLDYIQDGALDRFADLGRAIAVANEADDDQVASTKFLGAVEKLCQTLQVPTLAKYGIDREKFFAVMDKMATDAIASGSPANTRKVLVKADLLAIYESLWQ